MPQVITIYNGWTHIRFDDDGDLGFCDALCFVQLPPGFSDAIIPDSFIYDKAEVPSTAAQWNREHVNRWWSEYQGKVGAVGA